MRKRALACLIVLLPVSAFAADAALDWAYPVAPADLAPSDNVVKKAAVGAPDEMKRTQAEIDNPFGPPDWFPAEHPPLPGVVAHGRAPHVRACMLCHLANGNGHPESTSISGLTANYITEQMHAFRDGDRTGIRTTVMAEIARDITPGELSQAAGYFSSLKPTPWIKVIESETAPRNYVGSGGKRFHDPHGGTVPLAPTMIYEIADNDEAALLRDPHFGFTDYVPKGSLKKGEALVTTGANGKTLQCSICHGPEYKGIGDVPRLAGRSAYTIVRQLKDIQTGARKGTPVALMQPVVAKLSDEDIVDIAAYMASREP